MDTLLEILKWVILILLAGFIGQFGRTTSHHLMDYFRKRKGERASTASKEINEAKVVSAESLETNGIKREVILPSKEKERELKAEKKALKAQLKAKKKFEKSKKEG